MPEAGISGRDKILHSDLFLDAITYLCVTYLLLAPKYHFLCVHDLSHSMCSTNLSLLLSICPLGTINDVSWNIAFSHYVGGTHEWHQPVDVTKIATNVLVPYRDNAINSHHPDASASKNYNIANQLYCATYIVLQRYNVTTKNVGHISRGRLPVGFFVNSLRPSNAYMRQQTNHHWFR